MTNIYIESIFMAWGSILSNKMRSLLTMLGIIIGVAAVIALMSIGYGVQSDIENNISSLGSNTITVTPGTGRKPGIRPAAGSMQTLTYKDYLAIRNLPNISYAAPLVNTSYLVVNGNKNWTTRIYGCTEDYATLSSLSVSEGRFWTDKEYNAGPGCASSAKPWPPASLAKNRLSDRKSASTAIRSLSSENWRKKAILSWTRMTGSLFLLPPCRNG